MTIQEDIVAFRQLQDAKATAKLGMLDALGKAKLAESRGEDSVRFREQVAELGIDGLEGARMRELSELAASMVRNYPDYFTAFSRYTSDNHDDLVTLIGVLRDSGLEDETVIATAYELAMFERKEIGVQAQARMRNL